MKRITGDPSIKPCTNAACSVHHPAKPGDAPRSDRPVEMEVVRPDGRRVIRHIVPMDSCIEGTCGQAFMTSKPSSALVSTSSWGLSSMDILDLMGTPPTLLPDNPWYVLQFAACGPPGSLCTPTTIFSPLIPLGSFSLSSAPYLLPIFPVLPGNPLPNPNYPSPNPNHSNVMRHWDNMNEDSPVQVYIVVPVTQAAAGQDIFQNSLVIGGITNNSYTYNVWVNDILATFNKFTSVPTANLFVNVAPIYAAPVGSPPPTPFDPAAYMAIYDPIGGGPPPAPFSAGAGNIYSAAHLIWDWSGSLAASPNGTGPTGNGFNEVIFLQNRPLGTTGMASMDLDPATGAIIECDVIFHISAFNGLLPGPAIPGAPILPNETTAFIHEIGHFFGLDHTNLHPGTPPQGSGVSYLGSTNWPSWMNYSSPINPLEYPGMMGRITGFLGTNMVAAPMHSDDATGVSRIYPVPAPGSPPVSKYPLINATAEFRGNLLAPNGVGRFGDNVYPVERAFFETNPNPLPLTPPGTALPPGVGTISGTRRAIPSDVVGERDTITGRASSGGFGIIGVPAGLLSLTSVTPPPIAIQYDIVAEDLQFAGFPNTSTFGEWYVNTLLNPATNAVVPSVDQTRFYSNDGTSVSLPSNAGAVGSPGVLYPGAPFMGSFSVWPGTIIELGTRTHGGAPQAAVADSESRPLVGIFPRLRLSAGSVVVQIMSNYPVNKNGIMLSVNGVNFPLTTPGVTFTSPQPHIRQYDIPVGLAGFLPPPGVPARLRLTASELGPPPGGIIFQQGINEVQY